MTEDVTGWYDLIKSYNVGEIGYLRRYKSWKG